MNIVTFDKVSFAYAAWPVLEEVSFDIAEREFFAIIGPNGGGKTTILKLMLGLLKPRQGTITVLGAAPGKSVGRIGYVPQSARMELDFPITVEETVMLGRLGPRSLTPFFSEKDRIAARAAMTAVDILPLKGRLFDELSGGQKQRVLIARALVSGPELLLLDEPVSSVDSAVEQDIYALLKELNKKMAIVMVSHDLGFVSSYVRRIACVNRQVSVSDAAEVTQCGIDEKYHSHMHRVDHHCGL